MRERGALDNPPPHAFGLQYGAATHSKPAMAGCCQRGKAARCIRQATACTALANSLVRRHSTVTGER